MDKVTFPSRMKVYVPLAILFVVLFLLMPRTRRFSYDYKKGSPWMYETLVADFDFPVLKTEAQLQEDNRDVQLDVIPFYKVKPSVLSDVSSWAAQADLGQYSSARDILQSSVDAVYSRGVLPSLDEEASVVYIQKDKKAVQVPASELLSVTSAREIIVRDLKNSKLCPNADSLVRACGLYDKIVPDLVYDDEATSLFHETRVKNVSPTSGMRNEGSVIVSKGELVTAEILQVLDSYKAEYDSKYGYDGRESLHWLGNALISFILVLLVFISINYTYPRIFNDASSYYYMLLIFLLSTVCTFVLERANPELLYLFPFALMALYLVAFFKKRVVLPVYMLSLLPMLIFAHNGVELFVMYFVAGMVSIFTFSYFNRGWLQFVNALCMFVSLVFVYGTFHLIEGTYAMVNYKLVLFMFLGSMFSVAGYPLVYLFEKIFSLVSTSRLLELSDTNNKLLRELSSKAPGTFQHSLQVMNLADAVGRAIDADVPLLRCGALYHDIGKINNPQCFIENATPGTPAYHEGLSPQESAHDIIKHVSDGYAMAEKYGIPGVVRDFIISHHGTSCTGYFYTVFLKQGGDASEASEFFYDGEKPSTTEQIILMICDSVEAASRSLKDYKEETVSALVDKIVSSKMEEGQFDEAPISIKELIIMKDVLKNNIMQMYHARIAYPERKGRTTGKFNKNK